MIVSDYFHGDSTRIGWIQHDCYREALHIMVDFAIDKHCHAERVVDVHTERSCYTIMKLLQGSMIKAAHFVT